MKRNLVELTQEQCQEVIEKMATEEYYAMKLKAKNAGVSAREIVRMAIRDCHIRARLTTEQADYIRNYAEWQTISISLHARLIGKV